MRRQQACVAYLSDFDRVVGESQRLQGIDKCSGKREKK
jgi:hypothetical protein